MYRIHFTGHGDRRPPGSLADAAIVFGPDAGALSGLTLIGFTVWKRRNGTRSVTFPARSYSVNGERRSFALLRPSTSAAGYLGEMLRDQILAEYAAFLAGSRPAIPADGGRV